MAMKGQVQHGYDNQYSEKGRLFDEPTNRFLMDYLSQSYYQSVLQRSSRNVISVLSIFKTSCHMDDKIGNILVTM